MCSNCLEIVADIFIYAQSEIVQFLGEINPVDRQYLASLNNTFSCDQAERIKSCWYTLLVMVFRLPIDDDDDLVLDGEEDEEEMEEEVEDEDDEDEREFRQRHRHPNPPRQRQRHQRHHRRVNISDSKLEWEQAHFSVGVMN